MTRLKRFFTICCLLGLLGPGQDSIAAELYAQTRNLVYHEAHGIGLVLDVFVPTGKQNGAAIVDIASGAWNSDRGKIRDHKRAQTFDQLCRRGFVVFAVRPGSITKFNALEMVEHVNRAIDWVKEHAGEYEIDPDSIGLMGASAGGHLACLTAATADDATRVQAVAVFFPPTDFLDYGGKQLDPASSGGVGRMVGGLAFERGGDIPTDPDTVTAALTAISPARLVTESMPPFLLIHGDADQAVPLQQSETMLAALQAHGIPARLIVKEGGGHPWLTIHEEVAIMADWFVDQIVSPQ